MAGRHRLFPRAGFDQIPRGLPAGAGDAQHQRLQCDDAALFEEGDNAETFAVCALLHDVCKANFYKVSSRNVKNDATGQWEKVPFYQVADQLPYGHGEKAST